MARRNGRSAASLFLALAGGAGAAVCLSALRPSSPSGAFVTSSPSSPHAATRSEVKQLRSQTQWAADGADAAPPEESTVLEEVLAVLSKAGLAVVAGLGALGLIAATSQPTMAAPAWSHLNIGSWTQDYPMCAEKSQSPIDIETKEVVRANAGKDHLALHTKYVPLTDREIINNSHVMQVNGSFGTYTLPDGVYDVKQFHFHFPAEHEINGKLGAGELHIVHQKQGASGTDGLAVIGIVLEEEDFAFGKQVNFLSNLGFGKELPAEGGKLAISQPVNLNSFYDELRGEFFHYSGSLTTPPCAEKVHWYVAKQPAPVTRDQILSFQKRFPGNGDNRPVQQKNGRAVLLDKVDLDGEFAA